jgi:hypothetical protein
MENLVGIFREFDTAELALSGVIEQTDLNLGRAG